MDETDTIPHIVYFQIGLSTDEVAKFLKTVISWIE